MDKKNFEADTKWIQKLLSWANEKYTCAAYFNSNEINYPHDGFNHLFFAGNEIVKNPLTTDLSNNYHVGILSYELKNRFERLNSENPAIIAFPESLFFVPTLIIEINGQVVRFITENAENLFGEIENHPLQTANKDRITNIRSLTQKNDYIDNVHKIKNHILEGDIYEMNYCMAFEVAFEAMDPIQLYMDLNRISPMPFSTFFKYREKYVLGASPERFLKKTGTKLIAQPIKGTTKRGNTAEEDQELILQLANSEKEKAENLMIVDLMRNDLSKISVTGKIEVEELFGIYRFRQVSQMISTVACQLKKESGFYDIIQSTFPMGSMTGAPKIKCMELIDQYENFQRGWFSGSVGYIFPNGDFDFNVVIRSILMDSKEKNLYFAVGSAITYDADPVKEYEECMLKANSIFQVLNAYQ